MNPELQTEQIDREFIPDWTGLEYVGLVGLPKRTDPTNADFQELEAWLDQDSVTGDPEQGRRRRIPFDFDRCYKLAETGASAVEVAEIMGCEVHVVLNNIRARFGYGWKEYSAKAKIALDAELKRKLIDAVRKGNERLLLIYAMKFLGWSPTQKLEVTGKDGGPMQTQNETLLVATSTEELQKRRQALMSVVDRKPRFAELGEMTPTLTLTVGGDLNL